MLTAVEPPQVSIDIASVDSEGVAGRWRVAWTVRNEDARPVSLEDAWIPHGRFRGEGHIRVNALIEPHSSSRLAFSVATDEVPGTVVENAFLILRVTLARPTETLPGGTSEKLRASLSERAWRLFVRMRIEFDHEARPRPVVETVSTQSIQ
jgi:hypothetical protein